MSVVHVYDAKTLVHMMSSMHFDQRYTRGDPLSIALSIETDTVILYCEVVEIDDIPANGQMVYVKQLRLVKNDVELPLS